MKPPISFQKGGRIRSFIPPAESLSIIALIPWLLAASLQTGTCSILHRFGPPPSGGTAIPYPSGPLAIGLDGTLYGSQRSCAGAEYGQLFKIKSDGSAFTVLTNIPSVSWHGPQGGLVLSGSTLYGTTLWGGQSSAGTIFRINTDGSGLSSVTRFDGSGAPVVLSGMTLYGTTVWGGSAGYGRVFRINTDGSGGMWLNSFTGSDGRNPWGGLVLSGTTLYGTTRFGGISNCGTVFKINTGGGFTVLKNFTGSDGSEPWAGVALSGSMLFGTTSEGGSNGVGTVFRINTNGSDFTVLKHFSGSDGSNPRTRPAFFSVNKLCGTTDGGGAGFGTVFTMNRDGTGFAVIKLFTADDGGPPDFGLLVSGTNAYGMTDAAASPNGGVLFKLILTSGPNIGTPPSNQIATPGFSTLFSVDAGGELPLAYQWFFNTTYALPGATNAFLRLTNVQFSDAGPYSVVITNVHGALTSAPAMLSVVPVKVLSEPTETALRAVMAGGGRVKFECDGTIALTNTLAIPIDTRFDGTGRHVKISGNDSVRVIYVSPNTTFSTVNLTIGNGRSTNGAGILNDGTVYLSRTVLESNVVDASLIQWVNSYPYDALGGAILNNGVLNADRCLFSRNFARGRDALVSQFNAGHGVGGAICNFGDLTVNGSTFSDNSAAGGTGADGPGGMDRGEPGWPGGDGGDGQGGALYNGGTARLVNCSFAGNAGYGGTGGAGGNGGDWWPPDEGGWGGDGGNGGTGGTGVGGIYDWWGDCYITNCTIAFNSGVAGIGGRGGYGGSGGSPGSPGSPGQNGSIGSAIRRTGGIWNNPCLMNTLLTTNFSVNSYGTIVDGGHNLSSDNSCAFTNVGSMNNTDPMLGALADNGGATFTMALLSNSPAIDAGGLIGAPPTDQRGVPRPQGSAADIGAFEYLYKPVFVGAQFKEATNFSLQIIGPPNQTNTLQISSNLLNWFDVTNLVTGSNSTSEFVDNNLTGRNARFYRLRSVSP